MDLLTDHQAEITHLSHHKILDQITEVTTTPVAMTLTTGRITTGIMAETEDTSNNQDTNREIRITKTGMKTIKVETGLITEEDQTNINITETNTKHRSSLNSQIRT